jgi:ComF family protein
LIASAAVRGTQGRAWVRDLLLDPLFSVVFPSDCPACETPLDQPTRGPLCQSCWASLPRHAPPICRCGFPLPASHVGVCGRCRRQLSPFKLGASLGPYQGALRVAIHQLKYHGQRRVAARLAQELLTAPEVARCLSAPAILVPVPLSVARLRQRGFNQAELLAHELGRLTGLPQCLSLVRIKDTPSQTGLSAAGRRRNMQGAFSVRDARPLQGQHIVLIDDVFTTGATARACAQALRSAHVASVRLLTVARVA